MSQETHGWGGRRPHAGRRSQWPKGTVLKTMRLPAALEDQLKRYALETLTESGRPPEPSKRKRRRKKSTRNLPQHWIIWNPKDGPLIESLSREMIEAQLWAMNHFGKEWHELHVEGWLPVEVDLVLPDWLPKA